MKPLNDNRVEMAKYLIKLIKEGATLEEAGMSHNEAVNFLTRYLKMLKHSAGIEVENDIVRTVDIDGVGFSVYKY